MVLKAILRLCSQSLFIKSLGCTSSWTEKLPFQQIKEIKMSKALLVMTYGKLSTIGKMDKTLKGIT